MSRRPGHREPDRTWLRVVAHLDAVVRRERLTDRDLAVRLQLSPKTVQRLLNLKRAPHVDELPAMARACRVDLVTLLTVDP